jgi:hypothetical protein
MGEGRSEIRICIAMVSILLKLDGNLKTTAVYILYIIAHSQKKQEGGVSPAAIQNLTRTIR